MKALALLILCCLFACHSTRAADHLQAELSFLQPFVDIETEARAVRAVLAQRKLAVDEEFRTPNFIALSAVSLSGKRSAVRVITKRGVVLAEDADADDLFSLAEVGLALVAGVGSESESLLAITKRARSESAGCASLFRVLPDARPQQITIKADRFGSQACIARAHAISPKELAGVVVWPRLTPFTAPSLEVTLAFDTARLDRADEQQRTLHVVEGGGWLEREAARLAEPLPGDADFSARHARAIERAAVALAEGRSADTQLGVYRSTLGRVLPGSPEAELAAETAAHIERGWLDETPDAEPADSAIIDGSSPPAIEPDSVVIEPEH